MHPHLFSVGKCNNLRGHTFTVRMQFHFPVRKVNLWIADCVYRFNCPNLVSFNHSFLWHTCHIFRLRFKHTDFHNISTLLNENTLKKIRVNTMILDYVPKSVSHTHSHLSLEIWKAISMNMNQGKTFPSGSTRQTLTTFTDRVI